MLDGIRFNRECLWARYCLALEIHGLSFRALHIAGLGRRNRGPAAATLEQCRRGIRPPSDHKALLTLNKPLIELAEYQPRLVRFKSG